MKKTFTKKLILITTMLLLSSCAGLGQKHGNQGLFDDTKISQLKKGQTTKVEIVSLFGMPFAGEKITGNWNMTEKETLMSFYGSHTKTSNWVLVPVIGNFVLLTKGNNGTTLKQRTLDIRLNENGILKDYIYNAQESGV